MLSVKRVHVVAGFVLLGIAMLLHSVLFSHQLFLGMAVALASFVIAIFAHYGDPNRKTFTRATIIVTLIYGAFTLQLPIAVIAACVVYLTAWLTGLDSPLNAPDTQFFPIESVATNESDANE